MAKTKLTFEQQMVGFPWSQLIVLSFVRFIEPISFSSLFPYVYFMVRDFQIAPNEAEVSTYSGYLSSSFALFQVLSVYHWSGFSERHGRKKTLICGLLGTLISLLVLGFAKNFYQALIARSMMGLLNGNVSVIRTMIGEIATERRHQALAFSMLPLLFQFGTVIGPMIGGFLVYRKEDLSRIPTWFPSLLKAMIKEYPYALPNLVICCFILYSLLNAILFLEETHPNFEDERDYGIEIGDYIKKYIFHIQPKRRVWDDVNTDHNYLERDYSQSETTPLLSNISDIANSDSETETESIQSLSHVLTRRESVALIRTYSMHEPTDFTEENVLIASDGCSEDSAWHHVFHTNVFYPISVSFIMSLHVIVFNEFLPIFLAYDVATDPDDPSQLASEFPWQISGGIGYNPQQTGTLFSTTGIFGCCVVILLFPVLDRNFDCLTIFRTLVKFYPIMYIMVPYVIFLQKDWIPRWVTVLYLYTITGMKTLCGSLTNPQIILLIHNSSPLNCRAVINGATISISAAARFLGPLIWGYIMAWSQKNNLAWVSWWSLGTISMVALYQSYKIDPIEENEILPDPRQKLQRRPSLASLSNRPSTSAI